MDDNKIFKKIINDFFNTASPEELLELQSLLDKREKKASTPRQGHGNMDIGKIAASFASNLQERMGVTSKKINQSARDILRTMILQYDPHIPEESLQMLIDKWAPGSKKQDNWKKAPVDVIRTMISQFIAYSRGELSDEQLISFPRGWVEKYWAFFPDKIKKLIEMYVRDRISKNDFWNYIESFLNE